MTRFGFYFLLLFIPSELLAQAFTPNPDWRFENFSSQNHFTGHEISDVALDKHGYVWACDVGLKRFDGYRTIDFSSAEQKNSGLKGDEPGATIDDKGRVWVSSAGLCYYDDPTGKFIYVNPGAGRKITAVSVFFAKKNYLWFVCNYGLARIDVVTLKILFTSLGTVTDPLSVYQVNDNTIFVSSRERVYAYDIKSDSYSAATLTYKNALLKVFAITKSSSDIFLGTNYGIFRLKNLKDFSLVSEGPKDVVINDMLFLPADKAKKYLFVATEGKGLMLYNTASKKVEFTYVHGNNNPYSLPNNIVSKIYTDCNGRLWLGTDLGISMLDIANQQLKMRFLDESNSGVLGINRVARDKYDNSKVWMSSYNRGMICVDWKVKEIKKVYNEDTETQKLYDFVQVSKNKWVLVTQKKIIEWNPELGMLAQKVLPLPDSLRLLCTIRGIIMADANTCFITTNRGLFQYDLGNRRVSAVSETRSNDPAERLKYILLNGFCDNGVLWIASRNGLFSYDIAKKTTTIYTGNNAPNNYYFFDIEKADDTHIVCASGAGLLIFNRQTKSFKIIKVIAGFPKPSCGSAININGTVWTGTAFGILNYNLSTGESAQAEDEAMMMQVYPRSRFTRIDNDIVFGFRNGYAWFSPDLKNPITPSDPVIESVYVNNQSFLQPYRTGTGKLTFKHSDNSIKIAFTAFLYTDPDHIRFRYRLKGADADWQYTGEQRDANYAQLPPGDYTFYVQCGDKNGIWNRHIASFAFIIKPPYWGTWWFRTMLVLAIAFVLYRLYRYRINNILAIERIRERIASDFHDDMGSALSSISIFSEVANKQLTEQEPHEKIKKIIDHISSNSRSMLDAMDDIIWTVDPQNDHFKDLAVRMREFAIPLLEARNINFDISIPKDILHTRIKMEVRKNIFLVFKESVNNLLKHSCCTAMQLSVNKINNQLEVIISDNGKGFDVTAPHSRNGLKNMQKRADEIKGTLQLTTQPGSGTTIRLLINII